MKHTRFDKPLKGWMITVGSKNIFCRTKDDLTTVINGLVQAGKPHTVERRGP